VGVKGRRALVEIALFEPLKVYENARARIETMGLMGEKYVELDPGAPPAQPLKPESTIVATTTPASIDQVMTSMKELVEKFNQAMMTPDGRNRLVLIMERITSLTESIDRAVNDVSVVIEENRESIGEILKNILAISTLLKEELPEVVDNVNTLATQLSEMAVENREDIRETVLNLKKAVEKAPQIVERMDRLALNLEKLLNEQSVRDIKETIENVKDTSAELKELLAGVN
jgi:phospholipid/cholesterol/gamma-HCH transport system substrate-binding protein